MARSERMSRHCMGFYLEGGWGARGVHFRATQVGPEAISRPFKMSSVNLNRE